MPILFQYRTPSDPRVIIRIRSIDQADRFAYLGPTTRRDHTIRNNLPSTPTRAVCDARIRTAWHLVSTSLCGGGTSALPSGRRHGPEKAAHGMLDRRAIFISHSTSRFLGLIARIVKRGDTGCGEGGGGKAEVGRATGRRRRGVLYVTTHLPQAHVLTVDFR